MRPTDLPPGAVNLSLMKARTALAFLEMSTSGKYRLTDGAATWLAKKALQWTPEGRTT